MGPVDMLEVNRGVVAAYRSGGEIPGMHRENLLLLTTTGRRSGRTRTSPMMFFSDTGGLYVIASNMGATHHPEWYLNLVADPRVRVELGDDKYSATAFPLRGEARKPLWDRLVAAHPFFAEHQASTNREIPLVELRADEGSLDD